MYEDINTDAEGGLTDIPEDNETFIVDNGLYQDIPMPEVNNNYVNASVMLARGNTYARGNIIGHKRDADRNAIERPNYNPILDTLEYLVEFDDGKVSKLMASVIAESM